jgi:hypothetical protein
MTKSQAIYYFWSRQGLPAYDENSVTATAEMPYITYNTITGNWRNVLNLSASLWYHSTSWREISDKAEEIMLSISNGAVNIPMDGGNLMIVQGSPPIQRLNDPNPNIKRISLNIQAKFISL